MQAQNNKKQRDVQILFLNVEVENEKRKKWWVVQDSNLRPIG